MAINLKNPNTETVKTYDQAQMMGKKVSARTFTSSFEGEAFKIKDGQNHAVALTKYKSVKQAKDGVKTTYKVAEPATLSKQGQIKAQKRFDEMIQTMGGGSVAKQDSLNHDLFTNSSGSIELTDAEKEARYEAHFDNQIASRYSDEEKELFANHSPIRTILPFSGDVRGSIVRHCIPCGRRKVSFDDLQFSNPFEDFLDDMAKKWEDLLNRFSSLEFNEFESDLCDLLRFLNVQCVPDLFGLISLFGVLQLKYSESINISLESAINFLIGPFLSPIIGNLTSTLDQYADLILEPIECVIEALDVQLEKLDINKAISQVNKQNNQFNNRKIDFYKKKRASLQRRRSAIIRQDSNLKLGEDGLTEVLDPSKPDSYPKYKVKNPFYQDSFQLGQKEYEVGEDFLSNGQSQVQLAQGEFQAETEVARTITPTGGDNIARNDSLFPNSFRNGIRQSNREEVALLDNDIRKATLKIQELESKGDSSVKVPNFAKSSADLISSGRSSLKQLDENLENIRSIISDVQQGARDGVNLVKQAIDTLRLELERTLTGRVQTIEDQIELTRSLQQIQRWISIVNALMKLGDLDEMCRGGGNNEAFGAFVGRYSDERNNGNYNFYDATDSEGNDLIVIAPGGTKVSVTSLDFEDIGDDELIGGVDIKDVQKTNIFNDLNEAEEMNKKGRLLSLGDISGSEINVELADKGESETNMDLRAKNSYVIIKNDFCSQSAYNFGTSKTVQKWAQNL